MICAEIMHYVLTIIQAKMAGAKIWNSIFWHKYQWELVQKYKVHKK